MGRKNQEEFKNKKHNSEKLKEKRKIIWQIIEVLFVGITLVLIIIDFPDYPFWHYKISPSNIECYITGSQSEPQEICEVKYLVQTSKLKTILAHPNLLSDIETINFTIKENSDDLIIEEVKEEFYNIKCIIPNIGESPISCNTSLEVSNDYTFQVTYKNKNLKNCVLLDFESLHPRGSIDCSFQNECRLHLKVPADQSCGLRNFNVNGPEKHAAIGKKPIIIDENGLPYDVVISDDEGNYSWPVNIPKGEWRVYTVHILKN